MSSVSVTPATFQDSTLGDHNCSVDECEPGLALVETLLLDEGSDVAFTVVWTGFSAYSHVRPRKRHLETGQSMARIMSNMTERAS